MANILAICTYTVVCSVIAYLGLKQEVIGIYSVLIILDMITGLAKSYYIGRNITSMRFGHGVISKLLLLGIPFTVALGAKVVGSDIAWFVSFCMTMLALAECYSIIGNIVSARMREDLQEFDAVTFAIRSIMNIIRRMLEKLTREGIDDHGLKKGRKTLS